MRTWNYKLTINKEIKSFQREIYRIANNINQIARISNSRYSTSHDDYSYISKELLDFILMFEKEIYSRNNEEVAYGNY